MAAPTRIALGSAPCSSIGPYDVYFAAGMQPRHDEFRLRYQLFVEEHPWLEGDAERQQESDEFDPFSCAFLLRDRESGAAAACQRLILPEQLPAPLMTNVERLTPSFAGAARDLPGDAWAEVSRTSIAREFRWGSSRHAMPAMEAIKYASLALAIAYGRHVLFSFSDARTTRLTRRMGFQLRPIGPVVDFHGPRVPYRIEMLEVMNSIPGEFRPLLDALIDAALSARSVPA